MYKIELAKVYKYWCVIK